MVMASTTNRTNQAPTGGAGRPETQGRALPLTGAQQQGPGGAVFPAPPHSVHPTGASWGRTARPAAPRTPH